MFRHALRRALSRQNSTSSASSAPQPPALPPFLNMAALGLTSGSLSALVGLGGGFIIIPSLTSSTIMGAVAGSARRVLTQHEAQATSLAVICVASIAGGSSYLLSDVQAASKKATEESVGSPLPSLSSRFSSFLDTKSGKILIDATGISIGGLLTARFGLSVARGLDANRLKSLLGAFMMCVGPLVPLRGFLEKAAASSNEPPIVVEKSTHPKHRWLEESAAATTAPDTLVRRITRHLTKALVRPPPDPPPATLSARPFEMVAVGLVSGFLAGLFGVGGGALLVPTLAFIGPPPLSPKASFPPSASELYTFKDVLATSLLAMCLPAVLAAYSSWALVDPRLAATLCAGSLLGSSGAATAVAKIGRENPEMRTKLEDGLRWAFACIMIGLGGRMFRSSRAAMQVAKHVTK